MYICCLEWEKQRISLSVSFNYMLVIQLTNRVTLAIPQLVNTKAIENTYTKYIRCMQLPNLCNTTLTAAISYLYHKYSIVNNLYK